MSAIVDFLRARLDEDEAKARKAIAMREATPLLDPEASTRPDYALVPWEDVGVPAMLIGPERVLREVEAQRRMVDEWESGLARLDDEGRPLHLSDPVQSMLLKSHMRWLRCLASVYADHPDYDPTWEQPGGVT